MGLAFAFGWTPCIGPILAAILAVAGVAGNGRRSGAVLLGAYALGLGAPFVARRVRDGALPRVVARRFRSQFGRLEKAIGALLVLTGVAVPDRRHAERRRAG